MQGFDTASGLRFGERAGNVPEALSIYINQVVYDLKRRGRDIITLSLGEAFFDIPFFDFKKLDVEKCCHYSDSQGIPELRSKIARYYETQYQAPVDPDDELLITAGSKIATFMTMQSILDPGDEVLIHEPAWLSYREQVGLIGGKTRFIPYDVAPKHLPDQFGPKTKLLIINNPNNPAGRIYSAADLAEIYRRNIERGSWLLVDEAYSDFVPPGSFVSMARVAPEKEGVFVVNSLSKNLGLSGWRVGYAITNRRTLPVLLKLNQHLITCAPSILLYYLARYLDRITAVTLPQVAEVVEKRNRIAAYLDKLGIGHLGGEATFYFFLSIGDFPGNSIDLAMHLLINEGIAVVPGGAYGASTERFIRMSIGTESEERIQEALLVVRDLIASREFDSGAVQRKMDSLGIAPFETA